MIKITFLNILRNKVKELGEDLNTLVIDGDVSEVQKEVWYDTNSKWYDNEIDWTKFKLFTENYVYWFEYCNTDSYQVIVAIPRNPNLITSIKFEDLKQ
ncbi:hypothetical protein [Commensalibacter papalotli (ex Botero et al. 2024)]|uniref:hypothetical protein n=1 Tax=Commensalibacter papalotli (ex Botero et al. 2024) TaxID=2972766 RepID=UPI0022FF6B5B|nr:hypothetical protein [Commensalibacter papalotli (ex Botero et al. 2024)]CAI3948744.1 unnamed protein product [Commensalibacter papalotli (ex Botero et al. 2024)]